MMIRSKVHLARRRVEPSQMNSVFDAFNLRQLLDIHWPRCNKRDDLRAGVYHRQDIDRRVVIIIIIIHSFRRTQCQTSEQL